MAEKFKRSNSELNPELASSQTPKRSRRSDESKHLKKEEETLNISLKTFEKLGPSDESENSSAEGSFALFPIKESSSPKPVQDEVEIGEETVDESIGCSWELAKSSDEGELTYTTKKPVLSEEVRDTSLTTVARTSEVKQESTLDQRDSGIGSSSQGDMKVLTGGEESRPLTGENTLYEQLTLIGNGAYGVVYKARDGVTGDSVALKKVRILINDEGLPASTLREIATLKQLEQFEHPHIVKLLDVCQGNYVELSASDERSSNRVLNLWLVFELVDRDLAAYMNSYASTGIPSDTVKRMSHEIVQGVDFLHSHRITHRDLKPQNLLVTSGGTIKIADFGLAKTYDFEMKLTTVVVTLWYRAPEILLGCTYATPVDVWSTGCILAELCRLKPLFPGASEGDQLNRIFGVIGKPLPTEWPEDISLSLSTFPHRDPTPLNTLIPNLSNDGIDLIRSMLSFNPRERLTAAECLRHPYFSLGS